MRVIRFGIISFNDSQANLTAVKQIQELCSVAIMDVKILKVPANASILVGVGSSICGGSAIAATAPVIDADDNEAAQSIAVIFFFNVLAAIFFPMFILYFIIAAVITTVCVHMGVDVHVFRPVKELSKFLIIMAMAAIGLNSNVIQLIKTGGKPMIVGASCWCGITIVSLIMQHVMKIW